MTAPLNLDALQALCDAATPGEWLWDGGEFYRLLPAPIKRNPDRMRKEVILNAYMPTDPDDEDPEVYASDADVAFIAVARSALPALIQEVRRLRALIDSGSFICTKCDEELSWYPEDAPHADHCVWYKAP